MLGKIRHYAPVLLTTRVIWVELTPNQSYSIEALSDISVAARLTQEFAQVEGVSYSEEQATVLAKAARLHPGLIKLAVRFKQLPFDVVITRLNELKHRDFEDAIHQMIGSTIQQMESQDSDGEQASAWLKRLTVFRGGFTFEAALAVGPEDIDSDALYDVLTTLQKWGFVHWDREGNRRYQIDDIVTIFTSTEDNIDKLHFDYIFRLYGDQEANLKEARHDLIAQDWLNLQKALEWGWGNNPLLAIGLAVALNYYMVIRLTSLSRENIYKKSLEIAIKHNFILPQVDCQLLLADVYRMESQYEMAFQMAQNALSTAEKEKDAHLKAHCLWCLGNISWHQNNYENAKAYFSAALHEFNQLPDFQIGKGNTLEGLGNLARINDDYQQAEYYYLEALKAFGEEVALVSRANVLLGLGDIARLRSDFQLSSKYYYEALNLYRQIAYKQGLANSLILLGDLARTQKYYYLAIDYYLQALEFYNETGEQLSLANTKAGLADSFYYLEEYSASRQLYEEARIIFIKINNNSGLGNVYLGLAYITGRQGDYEIAIPLFENALNYFKRAGDRRGQLNALDGLGTSYELLEKFDLACKYYKELLEIQSRHPFIGDAEKINETYKWCENNCGD